MHAIGNEILRNNKNSKILYVTSEAFTNELINAIKDNTNDQFRNKYRGIDILLIDDIQFIAGKERIKKNFSTHLTHYMKVENKLFYLVINHQRIFLYWKID